MQLINSTTGQTVAIGDTVTTFRGEVGRLSGATQPHTLGSTGRVNVTLNGVMSSCEFFPGVVGLEWKA